MAVFTIVWLEQRGGARCKASRSDEKSARELVRQLQADGHGDVRYKRADEDRWRAVRKPKKPKTSRGVIPTAPIRSQKAQGTQKKKQRHRRGKWDVLDIRLPGSFESGKDR